MLWSDRDISQAQLANTPLITPFVDHQEGKPSYGLASYGYDIRLGDDVRLIQPAFNTPMKAIDPLAWDPALEVKLFPERLNGGPWHVVLPPHGFALARSVEEFYLPRTVLGVCVGKSTYARCGLIVNVTPLEPEWRGVLTLELSNTTPLPVRVYIGMGICQLLFFQGKRMCRVSYKDKGGRYQSQTGVTPPL